MNADQRRSDGPPVTWATSPCERRSINQHLPSPSLSACIRVHPRLILFFSLLLSAVPLHAQDRAITFNTNFEGASIGKIEKLDDATFRCHVLGQYDERGRNRQTSWYAFRMGHVKGRAITLTLTDFVGEYNDKPGAVAMSPLIRPVYSYDRRSWTHFADDAMTWDDQKKEATLKFTPEQDTIWIAHIPMYTTENLRTLLADVERSPHAIVEVIGKTVQGRDLHLVTVTETAVADAGKQVIWLQARQHAWEAGTSWVMEGALRFIASDDAEAKRLRERFIFKFTPMMDPDGVTSGKVRFNANGYDVNRHWAGVDLRSKEHLRLMPEIWYVKRALFAQMDSGKPIALMVNMHNTEVNEYLDTNVVDPAVQKRFTRLHDLLTSETTFDPHRPLTFVKAPTSTTNVLWDHKKVPVALMEQRVSPGMKLGRAATVEDRLKFGAQLIRSMARAVEE